MILVIFNNSYRELKLQIKPYHEQQVQHDKRLADVKQQFLDSTHVHHASKRSYTEYQLSSSYSSLVANFHTSARRSAALKSPSVQ